MCYPSFRLALILAFASIQIFAFELQVPSNISTSVPTPLNWTWQNGDPEKIIVFSKDSNEYMGGCQQTPGDNLHRQSNVVALIDIGASTLENGHRSGQEMITEKTPGYFFLCAYGFQSSPDHDHGIGYGPKNTTATLVASTANITVGDSSDSPAPTLTGPSMTAPAPTGPSITPTSRSIPLPGIIAGAVLGGIAVTLFIMIGSCIYRRKSKQKQHQSPPSESTVSPYPDTHVYNNSAPTLMERKAYRQECATDEESPVPQARDPVSQAHGIPGVPDDPSQSNGTSNHGQRERRVHYHDDSGWRPAPPRSLSHADGETSTRILEMPPRYEAAL
ncbi:hypothetical protein Moror_12019 [Moniliophthora roreri MCA 2997]|uniref:Uncharacterized protein n=2 Tax=Moniliophthora roreri TaxID=221103 RepID=V2WTY5_MONRO|nr:hypothetical protein Moror_12019 [Moniliophthora roreri MCA 2997]